MSTDKSTVPSMVRVRRDGTFDSSVTVAPGVRLDTSNWPHDPDSWNLFYCGKREALIVAGVCTDGMLVLAAGRSCKFEGTDQMGRPFTGNWNFIYKRGAPRVVKDVVIAWRDLPLITALGFPGAPRAIEAWRERERLVEERHRRKAEIPRHMERGHLRLVVDNTRESTR